MVTKEQLEEMMAMLDRDGDGKVTKDEFMAPYKKLFPKVTDKDFNATWKKIDSSGDGVLQRKELAQYYGFSLDAKGGAGADDEMTDVQILEALQMQTALAELQSQAEARRENSPSSQKAEPKKESRRGSSGTIEARKKNSSGVVTVKMPSKTTFEIADPNILFLQACELGDMKDIENRLKEPGTTVRVEDDKGEMPLHKLARIGDIRMIQKVLELSEKEAHLKTDINWQDKNGKSPVFFAADFKKLEVVKLLLDRGADPKIENNNGWTVLHSAANANARDICEAIVLHSRVDVKIKKVLVNLKDRQGRTPLHIAAFKAHEDLVQFLLQHGADAGIADASGNTAGKLAGKSGRRKSKDLLDEACPP